MGLGDILKKAAPLLGGLVGGPAGAAATKLIAATLGTEENDEAIRAAIADDPKAIVKLRELESEQKVTLRRLTLEAEGLRVQEETKRQQIDVEALKSQNLLAEMEQKHGGGKFVKWSRPFNTWAFGLEMMLVIGGGIAAVIMHPEHANEYAYVMTALLPVLALQARAIGIYVRQRTNEKALQMGKDPIPEPPGALAGLLGRNGQ